MLALGLLACRKQSPSCKLVVGGCTDLRREADSSPCCADELEAAFLLASSPWLYLLASCLPAVRHCLVLMDFKPSVSTET